MSQKGIEAEIADTRKELLEAVARDEPLVVVKAPPGSGKTYLIREAAALLWGRGKRVAVATQTNTQADALCRDFALEFPSIEVIRFHSADMEPFPLGDTVRWESDKNELPEGACVVVGTSAKFGLVHLAAPFDYVLVDEAWQMSWSSFVLLGQVAPRFLLVGDPGQIDPVVAIDPARWVTAERPPFTPAPELILSAESGPDARVLKLPASRRLPPDSVTAVRSFYDFEFGALAAEGTRMIKPGAGRGEVGDSVIDLLADGSMAAITLPTPPEGPPLEEDIEVAQATAAVATRIAERGGELTLDKTSRALAPEDIGIAATHRVMNARIRESLPGKYRESIVIDTPERWQGLERPIMLAVHPISGVVQPSVFDLDTGRLCVMASRHQIGLIVLTRDHLSQTLEEHVPAAEQGVGMPDAAGRGLTAHLQFWEQLEAAGRVVAAE